MNQVREYSHYSSPPMTVLENPDENNLIVVEGVRTIESGDVPSRSVMKDLKSKLNYPAFLFWMCRMFEFRITILPINNGIADHGVYTPFHVEQFTDPRSRFTYWAHEGHVVLFEIFTASAASFWSLTGLKVWAFPKVSKRLRELTKEVMMASADQLRIKEYSDDDFAHSKTDGSCVIPQRTAIKLATDALEDVSPRQLNKLISRIKAMKNNTGKIRVHCDKGQLKCAFTMIRDSEWDAAGYGEFDIVIHNGEWKKELETETGLWFTHMWFDRSTTGPVLGEVQTMSWLRHLAFPASRMKAAMTAAADQIIAALKRGEIPGHVWVIDDEDELARSTKMLYADGVDTAQAQKSQTKRWVDAGLDLRMSNSLMKGAINGWATRAKKRHIWAPVPFAMRGHIRSETFVREMCGMETLYPGKLHFDYRIRMIVVPEELVELACEMWGGADFDGDEIRLMLIIWKGQHVALTWRIPNQPGEYLMFNVEDTFHTFPLEFTDLGDPENPSDPLHSPLVVDPAKAPRNIKKIRDILGDRVVDLPKPPKPPRDKSEWNLLDDAYGAEMLETQIHNPGPGGYVNCGMVYGNVGGAAPVGEELFRPDEEIKLEDVIDTTQGAPYAPAFNAISDMVMDTWEWFVLKTKGTVDPFFLGWRHDKNRFPKDVLPPKNRIPKAGRGEEAPKFHDILVSQKRVQRGYFTELMTHNYANVARFEKLTNTLLFELRDEHIIDSELGYFGSELYPNNDADLAFGRHLLQIMNNGYKELTKKYSYIEAGQFTLPDGTVKTISVKAAAKANMEINKQRADQARLAHEEVVLILLSISDPTKRMKVLLGMYRGAVVPEFTNERWTPDRPLFGTTGAHKLSIMDLFIGALHRAAVTPELGLDSFDGLAPEALADLGAWVNETKEDNKDAIAVYAAMNYTELKEVVRNLFS